MTEITQEYAVTVHVLARIKYEGIPESVGSAKAAAQYVRGLADFDEALFQSEEIPSGSLEAKYCLFDDQVLGYRVEAPGDSQHKASESFDGNAEGPMVALPTDLEALVRRLSELAITDPSGRWVSELVALIADARTAVGAQ
jgi:hypothetical protein